VPAGIYAGVWGAIVTIVGVAFLKRGIESGLPFSPPVAALLIAIFVLPGALTLVSGLWLIWRARWAPWLGVISTLVVVLVSLGTGDALGTLISLVLVALLAVSAVH
jgi:hypothetical protein